MYIVIYIYYKYRCVDTGISEDLPADDSGNQLDTDTTTGTELIAEPEKEVERQQEPEAESELEPKANTETEPAQVETEAESEPIDERKVEAEVPTRSESPKDETVK